MATSTTGSTNVVYTTNSRYTHGGTTEVEGKFAEWWNRKTFPTSVSDQYYVLERKYEGRPDMLASVFYDDSSLWWLILQYNNILDLNEEFVSGAVLMMPTKDRIQKDFLTGKSGGIADTRITIPTISPIVN